MIRYFSNSPISVEEASHRAPAIFCNHADERMSEKYAHIPTFKIAEKMIDEGFEMYSIQQVKPRVHSIDTAKHLIRFRHKKYEALDRQVGKEYFEIVLMNSHNGSSPLTLHAGIFRCVCTNGLVVADSTIGLEKYRHQNVTLDNIIDVSYKVMNNYEAVCETKKEWESRILTHAEKIGLACDALDIKYGNKYRPIEPETLLDPVRLEDASDDLWTTFNIIQEHIMNGGLSGRNARNRRIRTRGINNIGQNISFNTKLWEAASKLAIPA